MKAKFSQPWFKHEYNFRNDSRMLRVHMELGLKAKAIYWDLIEIMHEQGGYFTIEDIKVYAKLYRINIKIIMKLLENYQLFDKIETDYGNSVQNCTKTEILYTQFCYLDKLNDKANKSAKAKESADSRWRGSDANALRSECYKSRSEESKLDKITVDQRRKEEINSTKVDYEVPSLQVNDLLSYRINEDPSLQVNANIIPKGINEVEEAPALQVTPMLRPIKEQTVTPPIEETILDPMIKEYEKIGFLITDNNFASRSNNRITFNKEFISYWYNYISVDEFVNKYIPEHYNELKSLLESKGLM